LFDRTNRGVIATNYGVALTKHARLILAQVKHAGEALSGLAAGLGGRVAIGTLVAAAASVVPRAIAAMRISRPNSAIIVVEGTND
jgi:DNA-binding transcriptional LysR family regulator